MSSLKIQFPPHTFSRLFRPWDMAPNADAANANNETSNPTMPQNLSIHGVDTTPTAAKTIKVEDEEVEVDDDYYLHTSRTSECASNQSNCSRLSDETELYQREQSTTDGRNLLTRITPTTAICPTQTPENGYIARPTLNREIFATPHHFRSREVLESQHQYQLHLLAQNVMPPTTTAPVAMPNEYFYATSTAAAMSRTSEVITALPPTSILPTSNSATAVAAAGFADMDAYALDLMGREYARIMAEEAQTKAFNARKQRPKKFRCPQCEVAFSNNGQLKGHIRIHTGERPFKCHVESCGKTFTRNEELTRHKRIHTGLRPYPCAVCGKKFGRRDHLKKHMKTHMPQERQLRPAILMPIYPYLYGY
ncbi:Krueppel-like factor 13 [Anastrepha obliqua]|uniref:Krueppel-like factor 13 n=1 Tax=Anastrepha obliqua TaxID=95512 RepID=UPI002409FE4E|nr:Krueppel-like factor 13 [Anastrepha obliqua]